METLVGLQPNHSGYVVLIGVFKDDDTARAAELKLVETVKGWLKAMMDRPPSERGTPAGVPDIDWNGTESTIGLDGDIVMFRVYTGGGFGDGFYRLSNLLAEQPGFIKCGNDPVLCSICDYPQE